MQAELFQVKRLEQQCIAQAYAKAAGFHGAPPGELTQEILRAVEFPGQDSFSRILRQLRRELKGGGLTPYLYDVAFVSIFGGEGHQVLEAAVSGWPAPRTLADLFSVARTEASRVAFGSGRTLSYMIQHPRLLWSSFMSVCGARFDPRGFARNLPVIFRGETLSRLRLDWSMGPTPTFGSCLSPEALAVIKGPDGASVFPCDLWVYANLQSLGLASERKRALALVNASRSNASRFRVASISVDSPLYRNEGGWPLQYHRETCLKEIKKPHGWYQFALQGGEEPHWSACVDYVVETAFRMARTVDDFHELVVLGLIRAWQSFCVRGLEGRAMGTIACKECIDRGGAVNAAFAWAYSDPALSQRELTYRVMSILWGRPILARERLNEPWRTKGFEALVRFFRPEEVRAFLDGVWQCGCLG